MSWLCEMKMVLELELVMTPIKKEIDIYLLIHWIIAGVVTEISYKNILLASLISSSTLQVIATPHFSLPISPFGNLSSLKRNASNNGFNLHWSVHFSVLR